MTSLMLEQKLSKPLCFRIRLKLNFLLFSKPKVVYLRPFLSFLPFPKLVTSDEFHLNRKSLIRTCIKYCLLQYCAGSLHFTHHIMCAKWQISDIRNKCVGMSSFPHIFILSRTFCQLIINLPFCAHIPVRESENFPYGVGKKKSLSGKSKRTSCQNK